MARRVITADIPVIDDCPVLTRLKAYVTQAGIVPTIEHVMRDGRGQPINLSDYFPVEGLSAQSEGDSESASISESASEAVSEGQVVLRSKEIVAEVGPGNPVLEVVGTCVDPFNGTLHFDLSAAMVTKAGVYQLSVLVADADGNGIYIDNPILWVEPSLFTLDRSNTRLVGGPPTVQQVRQAIMDNGAGDNLLLDDVEFSNDQLAYAAALPIQEWNRTPPPLRPPMDTRIFPFTDSWTRAIAGRLFEFAAHNYRRNHLPYQAGGIAVDDKNKEGPYLQAARMLQEEWRNFVLTKKYEINTGLFMGRVGSIYGGGLFH